MRPLAAALALIGAGIGVGISVACTSPTGTTPTATNTASTFTPLTAIEVNAQSLFFRQGCGTGPGQVYKYAVVVLQKSGYTNACPGPDGGADASDDGGDSGTPNLEPVVGAGVYDCFTDAVFNLVSVSTNFGTTNEFDVDVDAYDLPTYEAQTSTITATVGDLVKGLSATPKDECPANVDGDRAQLSQAANWTTTCVGTQQPQVQSMVACDQLVQH